MWKLYLAHDDWSLLCLSTNLKVSFLTLIAKMYKQHRLSFPPEISTFDRWEILGKDSKWIPPVFCPVLNDFLRHLEKFPGFCLSPSLTLHLSFQECLELASSVAARSLWQSPENNGFLWSPTRLVTFHFCLALKWRFQSNFQNWPF